MAGTPKRMAKKIEKLEGGALTLVLAIHKVAPDKYFEADPASAPETGGHSKPSWMFQRSNDPVYQAWRDAARCAYVTTLNLAKLGFAVRKRAGLPGLGVLCGILEGDDGAGDASLGGDNGSPPTVA